MTESEAARLSLEAQAGGISATWISGDQTQVRVAVARQLEIGALRLGNVVFLVAPDAQLAKFNAGLRGAIGVPVLAAMETVRWTPDGDLEFGFPSEEKGDANLCYDGWTLATEVEIRGRKLGMALDTGSPGSEWWPPLARTFPGHAGALTLRVGGVALTETGALVNDHPTVPRSAYYFGRLGMKLLDQARRTTIDFRSLRLRLE